MPERDRGFIGNQAEKAKKFVVPAVLFALAIGTYSAHLGVSALFAIGGLYTAHQALKPSHAL